MKRLEAYTHKDNLSSTKLLLKYNFMMDTNKVDEINPDNNIYFLSLPTSSLALLTFAPMAEDLSIVVRP